MGKETMPLRVFICDDDHLFAAELAENLGRADCDVRLRGAVPLAALTQFAPHLVLLDIHMPPPDGFEVIAHLCRAASRRDVSLVLMSGAQNCLLETAARFCRARGMRLEAVLQKPLRVAEVLRICDARRRFLWAGQPCDSRSVAQAATAASASAAPVKAATAGQPPDAQNQPPADPITLEPM